MKNFIIAIITLLLCQVSNAQNWVEWTAIISPMVSSDGTPSKLTLLNKYNYFVDESGNKKTVAEAFKEQNINIDEIPYAQVKIDNVDYFATKKSPSSDIRLFKTLKRTEDFFILCSENLSICDCKTSTFLYYIPNLKLQRIEKPFSFSLKRNLASRLEEWNVNVPNYTNKMELCELLEKL